MDMQKAREIIDLVERVDRVAQYRNKLDEDSDSIEITLRRNGQVFAKLTLYNEVDNEGNESKKVHDNVKAMLKEVCSEELDHLHSVIDKM